MPIKTWPAFAFSAAFAAGFSALLAPGFKLLAVFALGLGAALADALAGVALAGVALAGVMGLSPRDVKRRLQVAAYCTDFRHNGHGEATPDERAPSLVVVSFFRNITVARPASLSPPADPADRSPR